MAFLTAASITSFPSSFLFSKKTLRIPTTINGKPKQYCFKNLVSCKVIDGDGEQKKDTAATSSSLQQPADKFDRRNVLIGAATISFAVNPRQEWRSSVSASPIPPPDLANCTKADCPPYATTANCCPPWQEGMEIHDFSLDNDVIPGRRVRPAAHRVTESYKTKFEKAIQLMKELPPDDPRSFFQQANVHCAYCEGAYKQGADFPDRVIQVHSSWLFFPFHRWYLYFFERILGSLIQDPTFALPFWNWDSPEGMSIPAMYTKHKSPLYDPLRNCKHMPPVLVDLCYDKCNPDRYIDDPEMQIYVNKIIMYKTVMATKTADCFLGSPYRNGMEPNPGAGSVEWGPHNHVHDWTGDPKQPNREDMGVLYSAARDPIFYAHHSNVDRMWYIWKKILNRPDIPDQDFLESSFLFYDEQRRLVKVKVKDCLDTERLGYEYQEVCIPWLLTKPKPRFSIEERRMVKKNVQSVAPKFPAKLEMRVPVERNSRSTTDKQVEILVIEGITFDSSKFVKFHVLVNDEGKSGEIGPEHTEFAACYMNLPHMHNHGKIETNLRLEITDLVKDLGSDNDDSLMVTLVPIDGCEDLTIGGIKIE